MLSRVRRARLSFGLALASFLAAGVVGLACERHEPTEPIDLTGEACCRKANVKMTRFAGCRVGGRCRSAEPIWIRGAIKCGPVEERCVGGRCCEYIPLYGSPDAVLNWDDGSEAEGDKPPGEPATTTTGGAAEAPADGATKPAEGAATSGEGATKPDAE